MDKRSRTDSSYTYLSLAGSIVLALSVATGCGGQDPLADDPALTGSSTSTSSGSATTSGQGGSDFGGGAGGTTSTATGGSSSGSSSGSGGAGSGGEGSGAAGGGDPEPNSGLQDVGTLVILGDSIGDGGGQGPYYYKLLKDSLASKYGGIVFHNKAQSGSKTSALLGQINSLPKSLPGPVAVAITSGGNDMKDVLPLILFGADAAAIGQMGNNVDAALSALLQPNRFGAGVAVHVFEATIYDASDGNGNYKSGGCVINMDSPKPVDPFFANWNGEIKTRVGAHGQTVTPLHDHFFGHGFNNPPKWFANDCTHPNSTGHDELHHLLYEQITGDLLP